MKPPKSTKQREKFSMNEEAFYHYALMDFNTIVEGNDIEQVLHDFKKYYPKSFEKFVNFFKTDGNEK